jgi:PST family polysaccharide transporter
VASRSLRCAPGKLVVSLKLAASMGAAQTLVSMALSFLSIKITSVYLGPSGLGTLGQLTYFMALTQAVLAAGLGTGVVRRFAELGDDRGNRGRVVSTVLRILLPVGVISALCVAVSAEPLATALLHDAQLDSPLRVYAGAFVFGLVTTVILSSANGAKDFKTVALINIGSGVSSFVMIATLCPRFGVAGGLYATAVLPVVSWVIARTLARRHEWWPRRPLSHGFSPTEAKRAAAFVPMAAITAVGLPMLQLIIRDEVVEHSGMAGVGLLQGVMRLSDMYLGVASGVFAMYFFPRFSEIRDRRELTWELKRGLAIIVPAVALASLAIYLLRDLVIQVIFTAEFTPMRDLFAWQMVGNTLKMAGWLFGYVLLAKINPFAMAALEVSSLFVWWLLSIHFVAQDGALGATEAYAVAYLLYVIVTAAVLLFVLRAMGVASEASPT